MNNFFEPGKDKAAKGEGRVLVTAQVYLGHSICCDQDTGAVTKTAPTATMLCPKPLLFYSFIVRILHYKHDDR